MQYLHKCVSTALQVFLIAALVLPAVASEPRSLSAAPDFIGFTVNSAADTNSSDSVLTLREAILVANAGTNPSGLNRPATAGEQAQLGGCTFDVSGNITGGCGGGVADTIRFFASYTITLTSLLPDLSDNSTTINGLSLSSPRINANGVGQVFVITGDGVRILGVRIYGSPTYASNIWIQDPAKRVVIANNIIGAADIMAEDISSCGLSPNSYGGIYIDSVSALGGGEARAWVYGNTIMCNLGTPGEGISLAGTDGVVIGADELGNSSDLERNDIEYNHTGINIFAGAHDNFVRDSSITGNTNLGVWINNGFSNIVKESTIAAQGGSGVQIDGGSYSNRIGSPAGGPTISGTVIAANALDGVYISDASTSGNMVFGNWIGTYADGFAAAPNGRNGVTIDNGAHDNQIGSTLTERNLISGNTGDGIQILNGAHDNLVQGNIIGANISGTAALPNLSGIAIYNGAQYNEIGGTTGSMQNLVSGNNAYGIYVAGSNTATNTITSNSMGYDRLAGRLLPPNGWDNIMLTDHTHGNIIGGLFTPNALEHAGLSGIAVDGAAHSNQILSNYVIGNNGYGIILDGASTEFNLISGDIIDYNGFDGIGERNGAGSNLWTQISTHDNGGLGIDKFADFGDTANIVDGPFPVITGGSYGGGMVTITGTRISGLAVEVYEVAPDPSGYGEGKTYLGATSFAPGATWTLSFAAPALGCYTAFERSIFVSTEFGPNSCREFLPLIRR